MGYPLPTGTAFKGPFQPMRFEASVDECIVSEGEIPADLAGGFYRNGPTWKRPRIQGTEPVLGMDGMVQGLVIRDGRADFKNRWIRTPKYVLEEKHGRAMFELTDGDFGDWRDFGWGRVKNRDCYTAGVPQGTNNVNTFPFAGQIVASGEQGGPPIGIDPITLETTGIVPWSTQLSSGMHEKACFGDAAFTAHPKWDHETGTLYGWAYKDTPPYVTMHTVHPDGAVVSREIDAPYNSNAHDIWLTPEWVVMPFQPFINSVDRIDKGLGVFGWDPELPIVLALIPRDDVEAPVRYITTDIPAEYVMHTMSANIVDNKLILDAPIFNRPPFPFEQDFADGDDVALFFSISKSHLGRWTLDLETGKATTEQLSDRPSELPKVDERFYGRGYRWGYQVGGRVKRGGMSMNSLVVTDMHTLADSEYVIRTDKPAAVLEATFAPRHADSPEGDGYIIVPVSWWADHSGEFQIFDTHDITQGPICRIELPFALGWTPHGHWMDFR